MAESLEGFKPFVLGRGAARAGDRSVGVSKSGKLSITRAAYDALGCDYVFLDKTRWSVLLYRREA